MTTIAYDGTHLCADRRRCIGDTPLRLGNEPKIVPIAHAGRYFLLAGSGTHSHITERARHHLDSTWLCGESPRYVGPELECTVLLVELHVERGAWRHQVWLLTKDGSASDVTARRWAVGSGADYALGALGAGADAHTAVAIAAEHDVWTGDGIQDELIGNWLQRAANRSKEFAPFYPAGHESGLSNHAAAAIPPTPGYSWAGEAAAVQQAAVAKLKEAP